jgi:hypothetical protein
MSDLSRGFLSFGAIRLFMVATHPRPAASASRSRCWKAASASGRIRFSIEIPPYVVAVMGIIFWNFFERPVFRFSEG